MCSPDKNTLADSLDENADSDAPGMSAGDMPNWLVRLYLTRIYGDLERLFSIDLHRTQPQLDLDVIDSDH